ncbi:MAG: hypothetical protein P8171_09175 [Candidatus Thiodiazotropha sp.]|jgi:hypothetical protein
MKIRMLLAVVAIVSCSTSFADEVRKLRDMARASDDYRELAIQENMGSVGDISKKIKNESNT